MVYYVPPDPSDHSSVDLECPKCGRRTIVLHGVGCYVCLACDWFRDLNNEQEFRYPNRFPLLLLAIIVCLIIFALRGA